MPNLTQGQSAEINVLERSTLTVQNPGGHAVVESPTGSPVWSGGESNRSITLSPGPSRVRVTQGSLYYEVSGDVVERQNRMVFLGDSITSRCNVAGAGTQASLSTSFVAWAAALMGGAFQWVNAGVSGDTTTQALARFSRDVTANPSKWLHVMLGGNDVEQGVSADQVTIPNLSAIIQAALDQGRMVLLGTIYPFGSFTTSAKRGALARINAFIRAQASDSVFIADYYTAMVDQSGVIRSGALVSDNIHPSTLGASYMGRALAAALANRLPSRGQLLGASQWDADNHCQNGAMAGNHASGSGGWSVSGGVTGNGPRGWTASTSGAIVATASKQARSGNSAVAADFARIAITTSGADDTYVRLERSLNYRLWSSGGLANTVRRFYVPSTGAQYDVLVDGSFAAGADPTASWPTGYGEQVTDGTATLICVPPLMAGSKVKLAVECNVSGVSVGQVHPEAMVYCRNTASTIVATTSALANSGAATDGTAASAAESGAGLVLETNEIEVPATFDLSGTTTSAGPAITTRLTLYVRNAALATVDWGRATVRVR